MLPLLPLCCHFKKASGNTPSPTASSLLAVCCHFIKKNLLIAIYIYTHTHAHTHTHIYMLDAFFWTKWQQMSASLEALRIEPIFYPYFCVATYVSGNKFKSQFSPK